MKEELKDRAPELDDLVENLEKFGFKFSRFELSCEDPCLPVDVEWNYKDLVHVAFIHHHMDRHMVYTGKNAYSTLDLQKVMGITIPQSTTFYSNESNRLIAQTTLFFFIIVIEVIFDQVGEMTTKTTTRYAFGSKWRILNCFSFVLRWALKRNWKLFTKDDRPLRVRRGQLRKMGYEISDESPIDLRETLYVGGKGVQPTVHPETEQEHVLNVLECMGQTRNVGESDHLGVQVYFGPQQIKIFPRLCPHRGASLDSNCSHGTSVSCPWHGRKFQTLAIIDNDRTNQTYEGPFHRCTYDGDQLIIRAIPNAETASELDWTKKWSKTS